MNCVAILIIPGLSYESALCFVLDMQPETEIKARRDNQPMTLGSALIAYTIRQRSFLFTG
eukprot:753123-Pyramimonas_sp.AAC.1